MKFEHVHSLKSIAVVGATGLAGREFLQLLEDHKVSTPALRLLASERSVGETIEVFGDSVSVQVLDEDSFDGIEAAFFSIPADVSRRFVPVAANSGTIVVDDSSAFRMRDEVPLIVPQVNGASLREFSGKILATPNCSATPLALCLHPLAERFGIHRVVVSTYQSVSGAGRAAYEELSMQAASLLNGSEPEASAFPHPFAFNCIPMIGEMGEDGISGEEEKIVAEVKKILDRPDLEVAATAVRVPTFCGHGMTVNIELEADFNDIREVRELLDSAAGLKVLDRPDAHIYPTNLEAVGDDAAFVGRIRRDRTVRSGVSFWVMADNLRKGAALNALECLETLYHYRRMS